MSAADNLHCETIALGGDHYLVRVSTCYAALSDGTRLVVEATGGDRRRIRPLSGATDRAATFALPLPNPAARLTLELEDGESVVLSAPELLVAPSAPEVEPTDRSLPGSARGEQESARARGTPKVAILGRWVAILGRWAHTGALPALALVGLSIYFSFEAGGFFPGPAALAAVALGLVLVCRMTWCSRPFAGLSLPYVLGAAALGLLAIWTLCSSAWSHAPVRAIVEYDRVLLYLLGFLVFGAAGRSPDRLRWMVRAIAVAAFGVCLCGLVTRLLPDVWQLSPSVADNAGLLHGEPPLDRLSYPITYWNALGLLAGIGLVVCFALTCDGREAPAGRVLAAAALPLLGVTLLLTFSRGSIAATVAGLIALVAVARPRALLSGVMVAGPTVAPAVLAAYRADLLATDRSTTAAAAAQGHKVALVVVLCVVLAAAGRAGLLKIDARVSELRLSPGAARRSLVGLVTVVVLGVAVAIVLGVPTAIDRQYDGFVHGNPVNSADLRARLTKTGDNGRIDQWEIALDGFRESPLRGQGAGTFTLTWDRNGSGGSTVHVEDAHSLYVEALAELGVVGLLLVLSAVLLVLGGFLGRARGPDRLVGGALFGSGLAWALSAGVDWVWEMPAVTFWAFAAGGLALAGESRAGHDGSPVASPAAMKRPLRLVVAVGCLALVLVPARVYLSEGPLREGARVFARGDCRAAISRALDSIAALGVRPEPRLLIGYCDIRLGRPALAVRAMANAVSQDPANWETHYGLAVARAAAGLDPRPAARITRRLRPREQLSAELVRLFDTEDPEKWRRRGRRGRRATD